MSSPSKLRRVVDLAFFVIALSVLVYLLSRIGLAEVGRALGGLGATGVVVIAVLGFSENLLDATALWSALKRRVGLLGALTANSAGSVVNILAPWELGEIVKGMLLGGEASTHDKISGVVIWNYAFKLSRPIVSASAAVVGLVLGSGVSDEVVSVVLAANVIAFSPYVFYKLLIRAGPAGKLARFVRRFRKHEGGQDGFVEAAQRLDVGVREFASERPAAYAIVVCAQVGARVSSLLALFAITHFLRLDYDFGQVAMIYAGLNVAEFVLTVIPARLGVNEGAAFALWHLYGLDAGAGLLVYVVIRLKSLLTNGVVAPLAFLGRR